MSPVYTNETNLSFWLRLCRARFLDVAQCLRYGNLAASVRSMRSPIRSANWNVLASSEPLPSAKYCGLFLGAQKQPGSVQKSFTVLGRLRDLEAHLGNHLGRGETTAPGTVHGAVLRPGPLAENLGDGVAFFATEFEERHRSFQNLRAKRRAHTLKLFDH